MVGIEIVRKFDGGLFMITEAIIPGAIAKGLSDGGEVVRMSAMSNILNEGHGLTGTLADSIHYKEGPIGKYKVRGYVRTGSLPQAITLEYGTGIFTTKGTGSAPWFVHRDQAPDLGIYWNLFSWIDDAGKTHNTEFYRLVGARPHPYMYPAIEKNKDTVNQAVANAVASELRRILPSR